MCWRTWNPRGAEIKLHPLVPPGVGCLVRARRRGGMPAVHPCWQLTNGKTSRKRKLCCAMHVSSQQTPRQELGNSNVFSKLSERAAGQGFSFRGWWECFWKTNKCETVTICSHQDKNKTKKREINFLVATGLERGWRQKCQIRANMLMKTRASFWWTFHQELSLGPKSCLWGGERNKGAPLLTFPKSC